MHRHRNPHVCAWQLHHTRVAVLHAQRVKPRLQLVAQELRLALRDRSSGAGHVQGDRGMDRHVTAGRTAAHARSRDAVLAPTRLQRDFTRAEALSLVFHCPTVSISIS
jgi:hypothetical protein